jgi:hypothetical protein
VFAEVSNKAPSASMAVEIEDEFAKRITAFAISPKPVIVLVESASTIRVLIFSPAGITFAGNP